MKILNTKVTIGNRDLQYECENLEPYVIPITHYKILKLHIIEKIAKLKSGADSL